ncbi:HesA/MoeB/ThiF family protein [Marinobacter shengliensis]|uniref:ThiF family adenylyltransferase n=1 Tax=Marinobacter shengliensis TaxID=1389223 RepID=A0ABV4W8E6_9GAMM
MNYQVITKHLENCGYEVVHEKWNNSVHCLRIKILIDGNPYTLLHFCLNELQGLPQFYLEKLDRDEPLAHVMPLGGNGLSLVCVTTHDAVSVNFEVPELAFEASLRRHVELIKKAITDPAWNVLELTREFQANWGFLCDKDAKDFLCAAATSECALLQVIEPSDESNFGLDGSYVGYPIEMKIGDLPAAVRLRKEKSNNRCRTNGVVIPLGHLGTPPINSDQVHYWCSAAIAGMSDVASSQLRDVVKGIRQKTFWVIFNGETPSGTAWFGVKLVSDSKKFFPVEQSTLGLWRATPFTVRVFDKNTFLPRSGAEPALSDKKILIVGCGSVGAETAMKLGASGIGEINLADPDILSWSNTYRHILPTTFVGCEKAGALAVQLRSQYPWIKCSWSTRRLLEYRDIEHLKQYDLIVVAIGSPTHERLFASFIQNKENMPAVVNTWVEGFGVGGHATLSIPQRPGCLNCAYVDNSTFDRGLVSNLNFIDKDQVVTRNIAGCGDLFLPYDGLSASKTAIVASSLSLDYLREKVTESSSMSWKGRDDEAKQAGIDLTHRYYHFDSSMQPKPLHHEACDVC